MKVGYMGFWDLEDKVQFPDLGGPSMGIHSTMVY